MLRYGLIFRHASKQRSGLQKWWEFIYISCMASMSNASVRCNLAMLSHQIKMAERVLRGKRLVQKEYHYC
jgi:hypothetical protein